MTRPSVFDRWLWGWATPTEGLAAFRILHAGYVLVMGMPAFAWAGEQPPGFFDPPRYSLGMFFESMPGVPVLGALSVALVALYVALLFGWRTRAVSLGLAAVMAVGLTFEYSFGKIAHQHVFFWIVPLVLAFSPWGEAYSLDAARAARDGRQPGGLERSGLRLANAWPVALVALLVGLGYFSAGLPKALVWLDFDLTTHGARRWLINGYYDLGRRDWLAEWFYGLQNPYLWEAMDVAAVAFEVGFLVAVLRARWFRLVAAVAIVFHAANYFILNIDFTRLVAVYALFLPWSADLAWLERERVTAALDRVFSSGRLFLAAVTVVPGAYAVALALGWRPRWFQPVPDLLDLVVPGEELVRVGLNLVLGAVVVAAFVLPVLRPRRRAAVS